MPIVIFVIYLDVKGNHLWWLKIVTSPINRAYEKKIPYEIPILTTQNQFFFGGEGLRIPFFYFRKFGHLQNNVELIKH